MSRVGYQYDEEGSIQGNDAPVQHDNPSYSSGRANLSSVKRYNVTNSAVTVSSLKYNTAGAVTKAIDPSDHETTVSYADSFSDNINNRNTLAYPTVVTDADGFSSSATYNFHFGGVTRTAGPPPEGQTAGAIKHFSYDSFGRLLKAANEFNGNQDYSHTRFEYSLTGTRVDTYTTIQEGAAEAHSFQITDGHGRVFAAATDHPGSVGEFSGRLILFDNMGRAVKTSNPTETTANGAPTTWVAAGDDAAAGWLYTGQTYDWKGRPRITTNPDGTTKQASYSGCGCAGGAVVTLTDEGTIDAGTPKRRQQKIYADVLGRTVKTEVLNWEGGSVYSATVNTYNARDQITQVRQYAGPEGSPAVQTTTMTYDGFGRLKTKHVPEQDAGKVTTWDYYSDDTVEKVTDARGSVSNFTYNSRHLITGVTYDPSAGIADTADVSFGYDAAGNRTSMSDGTGSATYHYDQLSRMDWEERTFVGLSGSTYRLSYGYNLAGQLNSLAEPSQFGSSFSYVHDSGGRLSAVNGSSFGGVTSYASNAQYRAWGVLKHLNYGNAKTLDATYNERMQAATFAIPGVMSKSYAYYADGAVRFSSDLLEQKFDRFYSYDHAGRIKEAFSGAEARFESPTNDRPYRQTFAYDALGHLTERVSNIWTSGFSTSDTYLNNRRSGWSYDAKGNLLTGTDNSYSYDAAGHIKTVESFDPTGSTTRGLDGQGQQVKTDEASFNEQTQTSSMTTKYYLRSTVLGGQVITEMTEDGAKLRTFVYAGGSVLAWQVVQGSVQRVVWEHRDAGGASFRTTDASGSTTGHAAEEEPAELDPTGGNAGWHAPLIVPDPPDEGSGDSLLPYPRFSDPRRPGVTYAVDGIPVTVDYFMMQLDSAFHGSFGLVEAAARASAPRLQSYEVSAYNGRLNRYFGLNENKAIGQAYETGGTLIRNWLVSDGWNLFSSLMDAPQESKQLVGFDNIWKDLADITKDGLCRSFIADLIGTAQEITGKKAHAFSIEGLLTELKNHPKNHPKGGKDGIGLLRSGAGGGAGGWDVNTGLGFANIDNSPYVGSLRIAERDLALVLLHEIIHTATKGRTSALEAYGGYNDVELAGAVFVITGDPEDNIANIPPGSKLGPIARGGIIWDRALRKYCK